MKITKVSYGKTYSLGNYCSERIDLESTVDEGEDILLVVSKLKQQCDNIHIKNNPERYEPKNYPHLYQEQDTIKLDEEVWKQNTSEPLPTNVPILTQEQRFLQLISLATSTKELFMYEKTANNPKYPNLRAAYDNKLNELTK